MAEGAASACAATEASVPITVRTLTGKDITLEIPLSISLDELRAQLLREVCCFRLASLSIYTDRYSLRRKRTP